MPEQQKRMSEEKLKKIVIGGTVASVLLAVFLVVVLIVQFVQIGVASARKKTLENQIAEYEQLIAEGSEDLEAYRTELGLYTLALQYGWFKK